MQFFFLIPNGVQNKTYSDSFYSFSASNLIEFFSDYADNTKKIKRWQIVPLISKF